MGKFNFKDEKDFGKVKSEAEEFYKTISDVYCPYFKGKIAFNAKGLKHLKFKSNRQARTRKDQYSRLKLIHLAPEVLKESHTLQGVRQTRRFETQKTNSRWDQIMKDVIYYEFIAVVDTVRVRVVVKQILGGEKYFWSIVPFWRIDKTTSKRILHSGDPEND